MPIHNWTRVDAGLFHAFRHGWIVGLMRALNRGVLTPDYFALLEQNIRGPPPDRLTLSLAAATTARSDSDSGEGLSVSIRAPRTRLIQRTKADAYARKASHLTVRHRHGQVIAVLEIVSPGNKGSQAEFRAVVEKSTELIRQGVHLVVIDLFPPRKRDPQGIHKAIWDEFDEADLQIPSGKPLTLASYDAGPEYVAYVEFVGVGDELPELPLFLKPEIYVPLALEATYLAAWDDFPAPLKSLLDPPIV